MNQAQKLALWERIHQYTFEGLVPPHLSDRLISFIGGTHPPIRAFASKIAKKHNWTLEYAQKAIHEYKKFVYLGTSGSTEVTPSKVIDEVWHEHQLFTRGYREFCEWVLGRNFDHSPELIPMEEETEVFAAQFEETLNRYRFEFGVEPPHDIWGKPKFKRDLENSVGEKKAPRRKNTESSIADTDDIIPLYSFYTSPVDAGLHDHNFQGFSGGHSGGAGGGASFDDSPSHSSPSEASAGDNSPGDSGSHSSCGSQSSCSASSCSASSCSGGSSCGGGGGD